MITSSYQLIKYGQAQGAFRLAENSLPDLKKDQVRIEVEAFGLNYAEVMARRGLYAEAPKLPAVLGYEVVGTITAQGDGSDNQHIGKRVVAFCRFGGYSKHVITEHYAFAEIGSYDAGKALALATQYVTAFYMVERAAALFPGELALIHAAAGGVGTALLQLCKLKGVETIAKVSSDSKMEWCKHQGATHVVNYKKADYETTVQTLLKDRRIDVSFNPVAGATVKKDLRLIGSGGRLVLFGASELGTAPYGILSKLNFVRKMGFFVPIGLMMRSKSICGVNMLKIADFQPKMLHYCLSEVVKLALNNTIDPQVGKSYGHQDLEKAHADLENGNSTGKLVIKW